MSDNNALAAFTRQNYLNLETFRKTGLGVKTPVWFVEDGGKLSVRTVDGSGKVKRIRRNAQVRVVPSEVNGSPKGEWVEAQAKVMDEPSIAKHINGLMNRKYGLMKRMFDLQGAISRQEMVTLEIRLWGPD
jgi:uncharacterized protein